MTATESPLESCDFAREILTGLKPSIPFTFRSEAPPLSRIYWKPLSYRTDPLEPGTTKTEAVCIIKQPALIILSENLFQAALKLGNKSFIIDGDIFLTTEEPVLLSETKLPEGDFTHFIPAHFLEEIPSLKNAYSSNGIRLKKTGPNQFERIYPYKSESNKPGPSQEYVESQYALSFLWNERDIAIIGNYPENIVGKWTLNPEDRTFTADFNFQIALSTPNNITAFIHKIQKAL